MSSYLWGVIQSGSGSETATCTCVFHRRSGRYSIYCYVYIIVYRQIHLHRAVGGGQPSVRIKAELGLSHVIYNNIFITCYGIHYALYACIPYSGRDVPGGQSSLCMRLHFQLSWLCTSRPGFTTGIDGWSITDPSNRDINTLCNIAILLYIWSYLIILPSLGTDHKPGAPRPCSWPGHAYHILPQRGRPRRSRSEGRDGWDVVYHVKTGRFRYLGPL